MDFDPVAILRELNRHGVDYAVVGGFALAAHGVVRATEDLDLVTDRRLDNPKRLGAALRKIDAHGNEPVEPEVLVRRTDLRFETRFGPVHLLRDVGT